MANERAETAKSFSTILQEVGAWSAPEELIADIRRKYPVLGKLTMREAVLLRKRMMEETRRKGQKIVVTDRGKYE